jgi:NADH-quinone oxidoreductase subunit G
MKEVANDDVLGFVDRGGFSTIACHPDKTLESNYSLNTVDICPVGALTSTDFRFKMRVWFLKETKSIDVNDGLGCNILIGSRENHIYRVTPRENNDVNGNWIPDSHRLNFKYLSDDRRLLQPTVDGQRLPWSEAISAAVSSLKAAGTVAMVLSARLTNEELYLARLLATTLKVSVRDVVPRLGEPDGILIPADRNPNTAGAQLLGATGEEPGKLLPEIVAGVRNGSIQGLLCFGEDLSECGFNPADLKKLKALVATSILPNDTTKAAHIVLPGAAWAEKRGSMINIKGRLQRLNKAVEPPGEAHDDWEILRDLLEASGSKVPFHAIEDVFRAMAQDVQAFTGLNLSKIGDLGVQLLPKPEAAAAAVATA